MPDGVINNYGPNNQQKNVLGDPLSSCSTDPMTGFFRTGCCETDITDHGMHTVCVKMTDNFLKFSKNIGNDLSTPRPEFGFEGLKSGDFWCLCALRWVEAFDAGKAPFVKLSATNILSLNVCNIKDLITYAIDKPISKKNI